MTATKILSDDRDARDVIEHLALGVKLMTSFLTRFGKTNDKICPAPTTVFDFRSFDLTKLQKRPTSPLTDNHTHARLNALNETLTHLDRQVLVLQAKQSSTLDPPQPSTSVVHSADNTPRESNEALGDPDVDANVDAKAEEEEGASGGDHIDDDPIASASARGSSRSLTRRDRNGDGEELGSSEIVINVVDAIALLEPANAVIEEEEEIQERIVVEDEEEQVEAPPGYPSAPPPSFDHLDLQTVRISFAAEHVLHVELFRPKVMNQMNMRLWKEFRAVFEHIRTDSDVRCVVVSGGTTSKHFTAGLDLQEFGPALSTPNPDSARNSIALRNMIDGMQASFQAIHDCGRPVVAAVHGACIGAGIDLITACDVRYASEDAVFSIKEVDIGLAADIGTLQRLPKVVGNDSWVRELAFTGRTFPATEALAQGLLSKTVPREQLFATALKTATIIASKSPIAVHGTKEVLNYSRDHSVVEGLHYVSLWNSAMLNTVDVGLAVKANLSRKPA
ncbi:putative enoyl CoA hydratase, partial [Thoreauomyces humboldtii]